MPKQMVSLFLGAALVAALIVCFLPDPVESIGYYELYSYSYTYLSYRCYPYYYTRCNYWWYYGYWYGWYYWNWWWWGYPYYNYWNYCWTDVGYNCYYVWQTSVAWSWRCQSGPPRFTGSYCDVPACSPACTGNNVCKLATACVGQSTCAAPNDNYCGCQTAAGSTVCQLGYCTAALNCYPGSCTTTSGTTGKCQCPAGFSGPNCQTITHQSDITVCGVQVYGVPSGGGALQVVANSTSCAAVGDDPPTIWIATSSINKIEVNWEVHFNDPPRMPDNTLAPYIQNAPVPIGINETSFKVSWGSGSSINSCPITNLYQYIVQCNPVVQLWNGLGFPTIRDNSTFLIEVSSKLGGEKRGNSANQGGSFGTQVFAEDPTANMTKRSVRFTFDLTPPEHCLTTSTNCTVFPIFVNQSITSNPKIQPTFNEWKDTVSGIDRFHAEIFFMQPDVTGQLVEIPGALSKLDVDIKLNNFLYTCTTPGVYSIILTVFDRAGNSAKARKIITYNDQPIAMSHSPMFLDKADPSTIDAETGHAFINHLEVPTYGLPYKFTANWTGHFVNNYHPEWLARVKSWQDLGITGLDDRFGSTYSMRSIDQVTGLTGIIAFSYAYEIDSVGGIGVQPPENFTTLSDKQETLTLSIPQSDLKNGQTIVVWVKAYDLTGSSNTIVSKTFVDTDPYNINVTGQSLQMHSSDQYNSSVLINVVNNIGGIKQIYYEILDVSLQSVVKANTIQPQTLRPKNALGNVRRRRQSSIDKPCDPSTDTTCYCIPLGVCYPKTQEILIDNCWIDRHAGNHLKVNYTITSLGGQSVVNIIDLGVLKLEDIQCRLRNDGKWSGGAIGDILMGIIQQLQQLLQTAQQLYLMMPSAQNATI